MPILIFGVWLDSPPPPPPPHGRILPPSFNNLASINQIFQARDQEQRERALEDCDDPSWSIKKLLTKSDVNKSLCRLMLNKAAVWDHIMSKWDEEKQRTVMETEQGVRVDVFDVDTETVHGVVFKRWKSSGSFVFTTNWMPQFVERRELKEKDQIGLRWDSDHSRFCFCVLSRVP